MEREIVVRGAGEARALPDRASLTVEVTSDRQTQDEAHEARATLDRIEALLIDWIPRYWAAGKSYVTVAFGCTGGRHRSVAAAIEIAERLRDRGFSPNVRHRELASPPSDTIEANPRREAEAGELKE